MRYLIKITGVLVICSFLLFSCKSNEQVPEDDRGLIETIDSPDVNPIDTVIVFEDDTESVDKEPTEDIDLDDEREPVEIEDSDYVESEISTGMSTVKGDVPRKSEVVVVDMAEMNAPVRRSKRPSPTGGTTIEPVDEVTNPKAGQITAAEWNDLYNWNDWKELMNNQDFNEMQVHWQLFPRTRYSVFVKNKYELPLQDVKVELLDDTGKPLWSARTDNAGRAELWADINMIDKSFEIVHASVIIQNKTYMIPDLKTIEEGVNHLDVDTECLSSTNVDILFMVDATGSMGDEIKYLQSELKDVISRSIMSNSKLDLRMGSVFYRDSADAYITQVQPLTDRLDETLNFIGAQDAKGGGDYPEAVDAALEASLAQDWSEDAIARILFLLLDAPPHHNGRVLKRIQNQVADAAKEGIKLIPITASGINRQTEFLMKFMAIATNGTYVFITDHSGIGNPHLDPVVKDYEVEKLNDLLVRLIYNYTKSNGCNANEPASNSITFYPNPAKDFVNIITDKPIPTLKVLSNTGKLMQTKSQVQIGETRIDLAGLIDGVYTLHCIGDGIDYTHPVVVVNR